MENIEILVKSIFNSTSNKEELSIKVIKSQVTEKIGRSLSKDETSSIKEIVCELYESYSRTKTVIFQNELLVLLFF